MGSYGLFLILATFTVYSVSAQSVANNDVESTIDRPIIGNTTAAPINEPSDTEEEPTDEDVCLEPCPRIYLPVCGSRNGVKFETANMCEFQNKLKCEQVSTRQGEKAAEFLYLYDGHCKSEIARSRRRRVKRVKRFRRNFN